VQKKPLTQAERLERLKAKQQTATAPKELVLANLLFPKQLAAIEDVSPFKLFLCSRRAGKSTGIAADLVKTAYEATQPCTALYVTGSRTDAKKIVWAEVKRLATDLGHPCVPNESELTLTYTNGSIVRLAGVKDMASVDKIRGQLPPIKKAYIDEAQSIRNEVLQTLVDDVLEPALLDYDGSLVMAGTPPPVPAGYFIDQLSNKFWKTHAWTFFDNPHMAIKSGKTHQQLLDRVLARRGLSIDDPQIRREYFGELKVDTNSLVYQYSEAINHYDVLPPGNYVYIMGVDIGFHDSDALAVLAYSDASKHTYLVEELVTERQDVTALMEQIQRLRSKYGVSRIVMDTGGLGKKIAEELIQRYSLPIEAAEKTRKFENIELLNTQMRTGMFLARKDSLFAWDSYKVEWNRDLRKPDKKVISDRFHSDICDAVLYGWRESYAYTYTPPPPPPVPGTPAWEEELEKQALEHFQALEDAAKADPYGFE
jgi:hypothetical protein